MSASERAVILWDFDGTLAFRAGMWSGCLIETLDRHEPGHGVSADALKPALRDGFPWHRPETPHPELCAPGAWWLAVEPLLARAYESVGYAPARSAELASFARQRFIDWTVGWELFADAVPVLERLTEQGWRHVILSNHVPELDQLVAGLGLTDLVDAVITSAATGYEKPHADTFAGALRVCGDPELVWMVGDNPVADVAGAEAVGIPAILVRGDGAGCARHVRDLYDAARLIGPA